MNFPKPDIPNPEPLSGAKFYVVGGAVRDKLMYLSPRHVILNSNDIDYVVVGATEAQLLRAGLKQVGKDFPVFLTPSGVEIAMARKERKTGIGYYGFECAFGPEVTLYEDLTRRDFTINSIAVDLETGDVIDPLYGVNDIKLGGIRANTSAFKEDPLRVLRAARMAARFGFQIADDTKDMAKEVPQSEFDAISKERIALETEKAFKQCDEPSFYFKILDNMDALGKVFPELKALQNVEEPKLWHPEGNTFNHTMLVIDALKSEWGKTLKGHYSSFPTFLFWAALLHDFGKKVSTQYKNGTVHHYNHETTGVPLVEEFCDKFKLENSTKKHAVNATKQHMLLHDWGKMRKISRARILEALHVMHGDGELRAALWVSFADTNGRQGISEKASWLSFAHQAFTDASMFRYVKGDEVLTPDEIKHAKPEDIKKKLMDARAKALTDKK